MNEEKAPHPNQGVPPQGIRKEKQGDLSDREERPKNREDSSGDIKSDEGFEE